MGYDWSLISPEIAVLATAAVLIIVDLFLKKRRNTVLTAISIVGIMVALLLTFGNFKALGSGHFEYCGQ